LYIFDKKTFQFFLSNQHRLFMTLAAAAAASMEETELRPLLSPLPPLPPLPLHCR
jgi:hypothetical protein